MEQNGRRWIGGAVVVIGLLVVAGVLQMVAEDAQRRSGLPESSGEKSVFSLNDEMLTVTAEELEIPWGIDWLPDGSMLVTERPGRVVRIMSDRTVIPIEGVEHRGEGGLLGLAVHPAYEETQWVYLYLTVSGASGIENRVERYRLENDALLERTVILEGIPGAAFHDGGRIAFGPAFAPPAGGALADKPDYFLYITTGDAGQEELAQDTSSLAGKILRVRDDGSVPADNPFGNEVYSYGHRNAQGLAWDSQGRLWTTEHGRSGVRSGFDEVNLIEAGGNYGWPEIQGDETAAGMRAPQLHSGSSETWAPGGAAIMDDHLYFPGLRGETLYEVALEDEGVGQLREHLVGEFGRLRTAAVGPDQALYVTTSNRDGRGTPRAGDDVILRLPR